MYNVFCVCVCSLIYPACDAHVPHCHLWHAWLYHIFPHLINSTIFRRKLLNIKFVFWFSLQFLSRTFLILRVEWDIINVRMPSCKVPVICQILIKLNFLDRFSKNTQIDNFMQILRCSMQVDGQTQTDMMKLLLTCWNFANAPKSVLQSREIGLKENEIMYFLSHVYLKEAYTIFF